MKEYFKVILKKLNKPVKNAPAPMDEQLVTFLQATWCQKQLDDLLLVNQSVLNSLKQKPFDAGYLSKRDKIHHDISKLQPIVRETGLACARIIEQKYGVEFCFLSEKNRQAPRNSPTDKELNTAPPGFDQKTGKTIILPGQEKR